MKRLLITLMVLLLSVQTAMAAVCQYCEHIEHGAGTHSLAAEPVEHFDASHEVQDDPAGALDAEICSVCQLSSASVPTELATLPPPLQAGPPLTDQALLYNPSHIERIQRVPLPLLASS